MPALLTRIETAPTSLATFAATARQAVAIGDVERESLRLAAGVADFRRRLGRGLAVDVEHGDLRALARIAERDGAADAGAGAGDDRDVVLQKPGHGCCSLWTEERSPDCALAKSGLLHDGARAGSAIIPRMSRRPTYDPRTAAEKAFKAATTKPVE